MSIVVNGNQLAQKILLRLKKEVLILKRKKIIPSCGIILVGQDKPSQTYVRKKINAGQEIGLKMILKKLPIGTSTKQIITVIKNLEKKVHGLIVQLPLPDQVETSEVLESINPCQDIDCLTEKNLGKLIVGNYLIAPPTPSAILEILDHFKIKLKGSYVCLVGAGSLVGRPLINLLLHRQATVTVCQKATKNLGKFIKQADIVISGVGKAHLISTVKKGAVVIDAGVSFKNGQMFGDVDFKKVNKQAKLITPTPSGVGPLTVAKLLANVIKLCQNRKP